ncbi:hypothetical protein, partial [Actinomyces sp. 187325]|uniref:hypothetical protein n=2 Tax=unclassified Actinomyces TaxID=2609248 RepID=UPI002016D779|nr:hypothetical protein [Actinomyces sp. 187325]
MTTHDGRPVEVSAPSGAGSSGAAPDFGPNEWMVEEKREAWRQEPSSVSEQWRALFEAESCSGRSPAAPSPSGREERSEPAAPEGQAGAEAPAPGATPAPMSSTVQDVTR